MKYQHFTKLHGIEFFWKSTASKQFRAIRSKLYEKRVLSQNPNAKKLSEITVFCVLVFERHYMNPDIGKSRDDTKYLKSLFK